MELKVNIGYEQLLKLIKQLSAAKIVQLKAELTDNFIEEKAKKETSDFQHFLLKGPVMNDKQFEQFTENRKLFKKWRTK